MIEESEKLLLEKVDALTATGMSASKACKQVNFSRGRYYYYKSLKLGKKKPKRPSLHTIVIPEKSGRLEDVQEAIVLLELAITKLKRGVQ